jgi:signal transduction histidine kinase
MTPYIRKLREYLFGPPTTIESLVRNVLFFGFLVLLLLIAGIGYRSVRSVEQLEQESVQVDLTGEEHLRIVLDLSETAGKVVPQAQYVAAYPSSPLMRLATEHRLGDLKREMELEINRARLTSLAGSSQWKEFEVAYKDFWSTIEAPGASNDWHDERERMLATIKDLEVFVDGERKEADSRAHEISMGARKRIVAATGAVLLVGVVVAALAFYEIRRNLNGLANAYAASAESRDYLQSLLDSLVSGVVVIGQDGVVHTISQSFRKLPGIGIESATVQSYEDLFRDNARLLRFISAELARQDSGSRSQGRVEVGSGLFDVFASPLIVAGEQHGIILVFVDVSEMARVQAELRRNRALTAVGQMTAQIAHEIKNPLGSIRFAAEFLKRQPGNGGASDVSTIQVIERSVDHLAAIVTELSEFGRPKRLNRNELRLNDVLDEIIPMVADRLNDKKMEVVKRYGKDIPPGEYDGTELKKLFLNLIINAIEASEPGAVIELTTRVNGDREVLVEIADHGSGMDPETLERLFEPFYTTKEKGTGLGMAIAKQIAELHGGDLSIASRVGEGTVATVRLPQGRFAEADNTFSAVQRHSS